MKRLRMWVGTRIVRCGLRVAFGRRSHYSEVTLRRREADQ